jgi:hypothetical protein
MDTWKEHVSLEIADAHGNPDRLLEITQAMLGMHYAELIPQQVSDELFNKIDLFNEGGK